MTAQPIAMNATIEPVIGKEYEFSRLLLGRTEQATFIRFSEGGATVRCGGSVTIWEHGNDTWKCALDDLKSRGFLMALE